MTTASAHYVVLIHKDEGSGYGASFPDVPGVTAVASTLDEAVAEAAAVLEFAFEDWDGDLPKPRDLDALRADPAFRLASQDAVVALVKPSAQYYAAAE
ncbi:type II toxin-antitoxin system HicB family antitoxin [Devosia sp. WQ 349]|uniref:type II toxin-antitoxin system HicB family antitoxin n=1 Tax=Devosia sp. WQ 349K1 TaxID=2800329 RepID=UPI0019048042|nr:type II toxin-antitoxin system HicB family antitoxin [Devosia sp. WQ 349K1]MBK1795204.1 type II toxin-antitoxin system HicB family antitoxin [Devosia sp. WQ 349K1]